MLVRPTRGRLDEKERRSVSAKLLRHTERRRDGSTSRVFARKHALAFARHFDIPGTTRKGARRRDTNVLRERDGHWTFDLGVEIRHGHLKKDERRKP